MPYPSFAWASENENLAIVEHLSEDERVNPSFAWESQNGHLAIVERLLEMKELIRATAITTQSEMDIRRLLNVF